MSDFSDSIIKVKKKLKKKKKKLKQAIKSPLIIVKKDGQEALDSDKFKRWVSTLPGLLEGLTKVHDVPTKLYDYQIAHLNNKSKFRCMNKSRQIGASFSFSGESLGKSQLCDINTSVFISYNREEANEKIVTVQMLYESMPLEFQKKRVTDNKQSQVFKNSRGQTTRIFSTAQRPPRGKGFNTDIYCDEFAFWMWPDKIFTASVPVITRGTGTLTVASTPWGARGKFYDILTDRKKYFQFSIQHIPWWHCPDMCVDIKTAFKEAPSMETLDRVDRFGTQSLRLIISSMPLDDFQQEYELAFVDENVSYFPINFVGKCVYPIQVDDFEFDEVGDVKNVMTIDKIEKTAIELKYGNIKFYCCATVQDLMYKIQTGEISPSLIAGFDVGRRKDKSELFILEELPINDSGDTILITRFMKQFDRIKFEEQKEFLKEIMNFIPIRKLAIDANGIGMNLSEDMFTIFGNRIEQIDMQGEWKNKAAQALRIRFENQLIAIPDDEQLKRQIGSIKKKVSDAGFVRYDADKDKEHHGDKLWGLALASMMSLSDMSSRITISSQFTVGRRVVMDGKNKEVVFNSGPMVSSNNSFGYFPENLPSPINNLLFPGNFIETGSQPWQQAFSEFHTQIRKR